MTQALVVALAVGIGLPLYSYAAYPALLWLMGRFRPAPKRPHVEAWPTLSISVPVYNESAQIRDLLDSLLALDYPRDRLQIVVVSDASDDGTDAIVEEYADRGIELFRQPERRGKTAAENAVRSRLTGDIVVNTDASIRIPPPSLKRLVAWFEDPGVGLVSGRDLSVGRASGDRNAGESGYVGYEMWVRDLETRMGGIVGASGCFYAIRSQLHNELVPAALSRDFAAAMITRERGFRAISEPQAVCFVPRTRDLRREYVRKVRTMTRGMETLFFKRHLLNPLRFGLFGWKLFSHKICRWLTPWGVVAMLAGLAAVSPQVPAARLVLILAAAPVVATVAALRWPEGRPAPRPISMLAFAVLGNVAALQATLAALRGELNPVWEPTRRDAVTQA